MRAIRIALIISVALNLLVAGVLAGAWFDRGPDRGVHLRGAGPMAPFAAAMDPENRRILLEELRGGAHERRPSREEVRARFDVMLDAIRGEPFDRARLETAFADQRAVGVARQEAGEALLIDRIAVMTATERTAYADRLQDVFLRPRRR